METNIDKYEPNLFVSSETSVTGLIGKEICDHDLEYLYTCTGGTRVFICLVCGKDVFK